MTSASYHWFCYILHWITKRFNEWHRLLMTVLLHVNQRFLTPVWESSDLFEAVTAFLTNLKCNKKEQEIKTGKIHQSEKNMDRGQPCSSTCWIPMLCHGRPLLGHSGRSSSWIPAHLAFLRSSSSGQVQFPVERDLVSREMGRYDSPASHLHPKQ